jgi:hypothetical protein
MNQDPDTVAQPGWTADHQIFKLLVELGFARTLLGEMRSKAAPEWQDARASRVLASQVDAIEAAGDLLASERLITETKTFRETLGGYVEWSKKDDSGPARLLGASALWEACQGTVADGRTPEDAEALRQLLARDGASQALDPLVRLEPPFSDFDPDTFALYIMGAIQQAKQKWPAGKSTATLAAALEACASQLRKQV